MKHRISVVPFYLFAALFVFTKGFASDFVIPFPYDIKSLAVHANGQIIVAQDNVLTRVNDDGSIDATFSFPGSPSMLAIENEGMVLVKLFTSIRRFNPDGVQESAISGNFNPFALQPDGNLIVLERNTVFRINPEGTSDPSFASAPFQRAISTAIAMQEDGKVVVAASRDGSIARFNPDGSPDPTFNAPPLTPPFVNAIMVQPDGRILIAGPFQMAGDQARNGLVRLNPDGALDSAFNPASELTTAIDSFAMQANGKIIISSRFNSIDGQPAAPNIARLNLDGTLDTSFSGGSFDGSALSPIPLALQEDGSVLAGVFTNLVRIANSETATQSFTREGSTLTWLRGGSSPEVFHTRFQSSLDGIVWTDLGAGERIPGGWRLEGAAIAGGARLRVRGYVTGTSYYLDHVPGAPALLSQPSDRTNNVNSDATFRVFVKGLEPLDFQWFKDGQPLANTKSPTLILSNVTGAATGGYSVIVSNAEGFSTSRVAQLTVIDPVIFAQPTSLWVNAGSPINLSITAAGTGLTCQWKKDGQTIPGATSSTLTFANPTPAQTGNYQVVLTGTYGTLESEVASVHVNTALPDSWNPKFEPTTEWFPIQTAVAYNNELFMGGLFRIPDAPARQHLVKFKADGAIDPLFAPEPTGGEVGGITVLSIVPNGQLLVGGNFLNIAGQSQPRLARLHPDGTLDQQFRPVLKGHMGGSYTQVSAIEILPDGRILIGGDFSSVNGQSRPGLARLFPNGQLDDSFNPDANHAPRVTWGLVVQLDGKIIAYGWDNRRFHPDGTADLDFSEAITALEGLQADGKFLASKLTEIVPSRYQYSLLRFSPDGAEDPSFSPVFDNYVLVKAMRADGSFLIAGAFSNVAGILLPKLVLLKNTEPATQLLTFDGTNATWLRSATSPEVTRTTFEFSADGHTWTNLGAGVRIPGGWQLAGSQLNSPGTLRARGFSQGSIYESVTGIQAGISLGMPNYQPRSGQVALHATAHGPTRVILQMSTDLNQWTSLQTNLVSSQPLQLTLTNPPVPRAFYRLLQATNE